MNARGRHLLLILVGMVALLAGLAAGTIAPPVSGDVLEAHEKERTMTSDSGARRPDPPRADFSMPKVVDIQIRATKFEAPRLRNFASSLASSDDAVEFIVKTDGPIPIRALGPALYVGETAVTEVTEVGPNTYRFVAPTRERLEQDASISLSWTGQLPPDAESSPFRYRP
jgi:hypothetical protein